MHVVMLHVVMLHVVMLHVVPHALAVTMMLVPPGVHSDDVALRSHMPV